jgi:hypothetical protein
MDQKKKSSAPRQPRSNTADEPTPVEHFLLTHRPTVSECALGSPGRGHYRALAVDSNTGRAMSRPTLSGRGFSDDPEALDAVLPLVGDELSRTAIMAVPLSWANRRSRRHHMGFRRLPESSGAPVQNLDHMKRRGGAQPAARSREAGAWKPDLP